MKRNIAIVLLIISFFACYLSQVKNTKTFDHLSIEDVTSDSIKLKVGEKFKLLLSGNYTTGYKWNLLEDYDKNMIELIDQNYVVNNKNTIGSSGIQTYLFKGKIKGKTTISIIHKAVWDNENKDVKRVEYRIEIE